MDTLFTRFKQTIKQEGLLSPGDRVLVALSGGADSVALLKALTLIKEEYNLTLTAAHVHHGIRGKDADADCSLAQQLCEQLSISCLIHTANVPKICKQTGEGEEECGRRIRYEFFNSVEAIDKIATAHTLNDNAETLLLHLSRGAGLQGLRGIVPKRGKVIRPFIACSRKQVEEFCQEHSLPFATDSSNANTKYKRNFIRHELLPLLETVNPAFLESMSRCTRSNQKDYDYLNTIGEQLLQKAKTEKGYQRSVLLAAHEVERHYALQALFRQEGISYVSAAQWKEVMVLLEKGEGKCSLCGNKHFCVFQGLVTLASSPLPPPPPMAVTLEHTTLCYHGKQVTLTPCSGKKVSNLLTYNHINGDTIGTSLQLRTRLPGDSISLPGRGCTKTLKKLFNELKIPHELRENRLVLCDEHGIVWVEGIGCDTRCLATNQTQNLWMITIQ